MAPLPPFELKLLHEPSRTVGNADLRGAPFLIAAWASWCGACAKESPVKQRLAASGRIRLVGLNIDDDRASALRWLERFGDAHALVLSDPGNVVFDRFGLDFTPEYILVDAEGTVRWRWRGLLIDEVIEQQLLPAIDALASSKPVAAQTGAENAELAPARAPAPASAAMAQAAPGGGG
jgi:cytochrome c biogenesis protein CcmG/thiol:disulfide interchange protein DsbE